jgi:hypothetical protein
MTISRLRVRSCAMFLAPLVFTPLPLNAHHTTDHTHQQLEYERQQREYWRQQEQRRQEEQRLRQIEQETVRRREEQAERERRQYQQPRLGAPAQPTPAPSAGSRPHLPLRETRPNLSYVGANPWRQANEIRSSGSGVTSPLRSRLKTFSGRSCRWRVLTIRADSIFASVRSSRRANPYRQATDVTERSGGFVRTVSSWLSPRKAETAYT